MNALRYVLLPTLLATLAAGCATAPKQIPELDAARMEVRQAGIDPLAQEAAGVRLKKAEEALRLADASVTQHKPLSETLHLAYLANRQAQIAEAQTSELRSRKEVEQGEAERNRVQLEARTAEATAAKAAADRATANAEEQQARAANSRNLLANAQSESDRLRTELEALNAKQTDRGMVLTLGDVLFDTAKTELKPGATLTIDRLAEFMRTRPMLNLLIEGHTDSMGGDDYNMALSQRRADAVSNALVARGIPAERVQTHGLGKSFPVATNDSASGRQQNRRVEVIFSDDKGQFPQAAERLTRS